MFQNLGIWQRFCPDFCPPEKNALLDIGGFFGRAKSRDKIEAKNQILEYFGYIFIERNYVGICMAVGFHSVPYSSDMCSICRDSMDNIEDVEGKGGILAHDGNDGDKHAMHRECIKSALKINSQCPVCRVRLDGKSLLTWQERTIIELDCVVYDGLEAAILGTALGIGVMILLSKRVGFAALALIGMAVGAYGAMNGGRTVEISGSILLSKTILLTVVGVTGVWMAAKMMHRLSEKR